MINEGVTAALAARDATKNGDTEGVCTLQGNALTWWNSHVKTTTPEAAHAMPSQICYVYPARKCSYMVEFS
ncbi:hypothetical protein Tco_0426914, partial [Tanacetum coccineum]